MNVLKNIKRDHRLFDEDFNQLESKITKLVKSSNFLVIGGAGSIVSSVVKELFARAPKQLHVVDLSENNLAELVRSIRSEFGYIKGDFKTFCIDASQKEFEILSLIHI